VDLDVVNVDGSGERRVTRQKCGAQNPAWSPDGRTIAFEGSYGIYLVNIDGTGLRRLTRSRPGLHWESEPAWSPDGKRIAYTSAGVNTSEGIYVMNADGTGQHRLTHAPRGFDMLPAWSPDGRKILFVCASGQISDICVVNTNGSGRLRLTEDSVQSRDPAWQPLGG
jgi:Tol biopolymer transport system component